MPMFCLCSDQSCRMKHRVHFGVHLDEADPALAGNRSGLSAGVSAPEAKGGFRAVQPWAQAWPDVRPFNRLPGIGHKWAPSFVLHS